jgi:hypothetical protein
VAVIVAAVVAAAVAAGRQAGRRVGGDYDWDCKTDGAGRGEGNFGSILIIINGKRYRAAPTREEGTETSCR